MVRGSSAFAWFLAALLAAVATSHGGGTLDPRVTDGFARSTAVSLGTTRPDSADALAELRRCIDDRRAAACRRAIKIGLSPLPAARAWTFLGMELEHVDGGGEDPESSAARAYREAIRVYPDYALAHYRLGSLLLHVEPRQATAALETALRLRPDWDAAREALARVLEYAGRWDEAAKLRERVLESQPGEAANAWQLAQSLVQLSRWPDAIPHLETVCRSPIATTRSWVMLGEALEKASRPSDARAAYRQALLARESREPPDDTQRVVWSWALNGLARVGDAEDAIAARLRWIANDPGLQPEAITKALLEGSAWMPCRWHRELHVALAGSYEEQGRPGDAEKQKEALLAPYREAVAQAPARPDLHDSLAETLTALGRTEEAIREAREAVRLDAKQPGWHRILSFRLEAAGRVEDALAAAETWRVLDKINAQAICRTASLLLKLRRDNEAFDVLRAGVLSAQDRPTVVGTLVSALESRGRAEEALPWLRQWFAIETGIRYVYVVPGGTRETDLAAAAVYRQAALRAPNDPVPECALGARLPHLDSPADESLEAYRRCAAKGPRLAWAQAELGLRLGELGRHREAIESLEAAEKLEPGFLKDRSGFNSALDRSRQRLKEGATTP